MDNTVSDPEVIKLSRCVVSAANRLRNANPSHPLLVWYEKLWESDDLPEQTVRLRARTFVHRFTTDQEIRNFFMICDHHKVAVLVEYLGAIEYALLETTDADTSERETENA